MNRLRVFFLFSALLALATAFVACGDDGGGGSGDPQAVIEEATFEGVESGELELSLGIDAKGEEGGSVDVSLSGPFQSRGEEKAPELDLTARADGSIGGEEVNFEGGLVLLPDKAFVNYEGTSYEVDPTTYGFVEAMLKELQKQGEAQEDKSESAEDTACQEAIGEIEIGNFVDNLSDDGSADVGGAKTTKVSGDLDVAGTFDALIELMEEPECKALFGAAEPLPPTAELEGAKGDVEEALKATHVDLYVGEDDIVRRISARFTIEPEESGEVETVDLTLDLSLTGVNEEQQISAPAGARELGDLFLKLGINPIELAGAAGGGDIGGLLEGLGGALSGESSGGGGSSSGGGQQAYLNCLKGATSPVDIQRCTEKLR